ncbi:hypothetical protein H310_13992 [Aphanomyces invadans]|uniref:Uncharacterized protein n=1 Tax=Aphanomyces invadans TaxID=157072 RepID=A0A024TBD7_9STRA|nr:hypothetical protein H310_13992 [Aphanomyces invadans]ETV91450.1 hypothetical protein H310_13992 [Aphanomyces invadans]|eukprot:XP_008879902.1 hypothetical protein H310_13992 [Aphanomyces invadans]
MTPLYSILPRPNDVLTPPARCTRVEQVCQTLDAWNYIKRHHKNQKATEPWTRPILDYTRGSLEGGRDGGVEFGKGLLRPRDCSVVAVAAVVAPQQRVVLADARVVAVGPAAPNVGDPRPHRVDEVAACFVAFRALVGVEVPVLDLVVPPPGRSFHRHAVVAAQQRRREVLDTVRPAMAAVRVHVAIVGPLLHVLGHGVVVLDSIQPVCLANHAQLVRDLHPQVAFLGWQGRRRLGGRVRRWGQSVSAVRNDMMRSGADDADLVRVVVFEVARAVIPHRHFTRWVLCTQRATAGRFWRVGAQEVVAGVVDVSFDGAACSARLHRQRRRHDARGPLRISFRVLEVAHAVAPRVRDAPVGALAVGTAVVVVVSVGRDEIVPVVVNVGFDSGACDVGDGHRDHREGGHCLEGRPHVADV